MCLCKADDRRVRVHDGEPDPVRRLHLHAHPDTVLTLRIQATIRRLRETFESVFHPAR